MRVLIDTHYVLWAAINSKRMEAWAGKLIANLDNEILVSAASVYEISLSHFLAQIQGSCSVHVNPEWMSRIRREARLSHAPMNPASFRALRSNVGVARQPNRRWRALIRQSANSAGESFHT
jgi:PIN domain nuclease of toxin-antitoxin system